MNAFDSARLIEAKSLALLTPFLQEKAHKGQFVLCLKGALAKALQETAGDALFNTADGTVWSVELKADDTDYPNLFLETFSNKNLDSPLNHSGRGSRAGWLITQGADILLYHRLQFDELLAIPMLRLKRWALGHEGEPARIYGFPEKRQGQRAQLNDTWGRCVPIAVIEREVGLRRFSVKQLTLWDQGDVA
jgi:hypothetical protein